MLTLLSHMHLQLILLWFHKVNIDYTHMHWTSFMVLTFFGAFVPQEIILLSLVAHPCILTVFVMEMDI